MNYYLGPELAALAPMVPPIDFADVAAVRAFSAQLGFGPCGKELAAQRALSVPAIRSYSSVTDAMQTKSVTAICCHRLFMPAKVRPDEVIDDDRGPYRM